MDADELLEVLRRLLASVPNGSSDIKDDECDVALRRLLGNSRNPKEDKRVYAAYWAKPEFKWPTPEEIEVVPIAKVDPCSVERPKDQTVVDPRTATVGRTERAATAQQSSTGTAS